MTASESHHDYKQPRKAQSPEVVPTIAAAALLPTLALGRRGRLLEVRLDDLLHVAK